MHGSISLVDGVVIIAGTSAADTARVTYDDRGTPLQINDDRVSVSLTHNGETHAEGYNVRRQVFNALTGNFNWVANVTSIRFSGDAGNDTFRNDSSLPAMAYGGNGADHLVGGSGDDHLYGDAGNDNLEGRDGNDRLHGDIGNDTAYGGAGRDSLFGDSGEDWLLGGTENDVLYGGSGSDLLAGEAGNDWLCGGVDSAVDGAVDTLWGGIGADMFVVEYTWTGGGQWIGDYVRVDTVGDFAPGEGDILGEQWR